MFEVWEATLAEADKDGPRPRYHVGGEALTVELAAIRWLADEGKPGVVTGPETWWQIMFLLFWDQIFAPIPDTFSPEWGEFPSERQDIPRDLFTPDFFRARDALLANRVQELRAKGHHQDLMKAVSNHLPTPCRIFQSCDDTQLKTIEFVSARTPTPALLAICERLLRNFNENRRGLPDLFVSLESAPALVEVKGPTDKLSSAQRDWLGFLEKKAGTRTAVLAINHTEAQRAKLTRPVAGAKSSVVVRFRRSSSKKFSEALELARSAGALSTIEGNELPYQVEFQSSGALDILKLLEIVGGWKGTEVLIDGQLRDPKSLRNPLRCYAQREDEGGQTAWCDSGGHVGGKNRFGCRLVHLEGFSEYSGDWSDYGYIDTDTGEFVFDTQRLESEVTPQFEPLAVCPAFRMRVAKARLKKIPARVHPERDKGWAYEDTKNYTKWMMTKKGWVNDNGETDFPGFRMMAGVSEVATKDLREAERERRELDELDELDELERYDHDSFDAPSRASGCLGGALKLVLIVALLLILVAVVRSLA